MRCCLRGAILSDFGTISTRFQKRGVFLEIIISQKTNQPIYEQITSQVKEMVMDGRLKHGDPIPSMRSLAKSLCISVITVQRAYDDLQKAGFIETTVGKGSFISTNGKLFYQEELQKRAEKHLTEAAKIARSSGIPLEKLIELLKIFYEENE